MVFKESCPGSREIRTPYPEEIRCFWCDTVNEMWSDEVEADCKKCGKKLTREMQPSCIEWCPAARDCVGAEKYDRLMAARKK
ncbi:MAG: hypothetical protein WAV13_05850 [Thermodesulfovibrionales bacterium]